MKNINTKALMVVVLLAASVAATPVMVSGYDYEDDYSYDQFGITDPSQIISSFRGGFGNLFSGLGYGGNLLGTVFTMLLMEGLENFTTSDILPGVYTLSASTVRSYNDSRNFDPGEHEYFMLPRDYNMSAIPASLGQPYLDLYKQGDYTFNLTIGAAVTLVIWDSDGSFIRAVEKLIDAFRSIKNYLDQPIHDQIPEDLIKKGVEVITWFLIHINDIFTGDELFILNPITWQKLEIIPGPSYSLTKTWRVTGSDHDVVPTDAAIKDLTTTDLNDVNGSELLNQWNMTAIARKDSYMEWSLREIEDTNVAETVFTSFTFDLLQLWIKNFEIHINVAEIVKLFQNGGEGTPVDIGKIFQGMNIDFYLFSHHLTGAFLYNDLDMNNKLSTQYARVNETNTDTPLLVDGNEIYTPTSSELTHRLILGRVSDFAFQEPEKPSPDANKFSWGIDIINPEISPVPVGVDLDSYLNTPKENLAYIHFGFTFEPHELTLPTTDGGSVPVLYGAVKLDQEFGPWNSPDGYYSNSDITGLDLAIIYVSTVLHFQFTAAVNSQPDDEILNPDDDYIQADHELKIGNYLGRDIAGKLDFIDIAGEFYDYGNETTPARERGSATTDTIPTALLMYEMERHDTFIMDNGTPYQTFSTDIGLNITFNVFAYAVCFPDFEDGSGIWHDPTFSVYMVFEAQGFWAIILLVAGVGLVGVATILIKRRKDARF
jgi:hypothetical protein